MDAATHLLALFDGTQLSMAERATIAKNFEGLLAKTAVAAANITMDADVVLVAAGEGLHSEERVRANRAVLMRASPGFRGVLEESRPGEIKLWRSGATNELHPIAAVRFVMGVLHVGAAQEEWEPKVGLDMGTTLPLGILTSACQIADCWDCPAVFAAAARCVPDALAAEREPETVASALSRMLQLVPSGPNICDEVLQFRMAVETAIARAVPFGWIPSMLKGLDLESACRVINEIVDLPVELDTITVRDARLLNTINAQETHMPSAKLLGGRKSGGRRLGCTFELTVEAGRKFTDEHWSSAEECQQKLDAVNARLAMPLGADSAVLLSSRAKLEEELRVLKLPRVGCWLSVHGPTMVLGTGSHLWIQPDSRHKDTIKRSLVREGDEHAVVTNCSGWADWGSTEELGGFRVGGTVVISRLQRQCQALDGYFRAVGIKRMPGPCIVVGCLDRILLESGCRETKVQFGLKLRAPSVPREPDLWSPPAYLFGPGPDPSDLDLWVDGWGVSTSMAPRSEVTLSSTCILPGRAGAAATLGDSLKQLVVCRLDNRNGSTNRAVASLDKSIMLFILEQQSFPGFWAQRHYNFFTWDTSGLRMEKTLLRIAVDWSTRPWRSEQDIGEVMERVKLAGVPTRTLLGLDEVACDDHHSSMPRNVILRYQLHRLEDKVPLVHRLLTDALGAQMRASTDSISGRVQEDSGLLRKCFKDFSPTFPVDWQMLYLVKGAARQARRAREQLQEVRKELSEMSIKLAAAEARAA